VTRCLDHDAPMRYVAAPTWAALHPEHATFVSTTAQSTSSLLPGPSGLATDPISTATLPLPGAYRGCRIVRPPQVDPTNATYTFPVTDDLVLMGGPVLAITFTTTAPDTELNVRIWDLDDIGGAQGLVTRGTYRSLDLPGSSRTARFQLQPQGYRFPAGHTLKVEVAANDFPYHQASNIPALVQVERLEVTLPLLATPTTTPDVAAPAPAAAEPQQIPATGGHTLPLAAFALALIALLGRRLQRE
jgi:hypothetical protein